MLSSAGTNRRHVQMVSTGGGAAVEMRPSPQLDREHTNRALTNRVLTNRVSILGVDVDGISLAEARTFVEKMIRRGRGMDADSGAHIVTANPEIVMEARRNPAFADALARAELVLPDGIGVVWAARLLGTPVVERVPGIELTEALLETAARRGYRVFFLGAAHGVAEEAAAAVERKYPGIRIVGTHHGYFSADEETAVVEQVVAAAPDILFVGLGAPRQELFIARHRAGWNVPVAIGVGGSLDVLAGRVPRAPRWVQSMGLEWLYRVVREPRRLRRVMALPRFGVLVLLDAMRRNLL